MRIHLLLIILLSCSSVFADLPERRHNLEFNQLAQRWDEAVPLGNGMLGSLVWEEGATLRFSLDRADLWDSRPVPNFQKDNFNFDWIYQNILAGKIEPVRELCDKPYDSDPAPTKIPAGRLEFDQSTFGTVQGVRLDISQAQCNVIWSEGVHLKTFIHATQPIGWFHIRNVTSSLRPTIIPPPFGGSDAQRTNGADSLSGHALNTLGYPEPEIENGENYISYIQKGWGDFEFAIYCAWTYQNESDLIGAWSIHSSETSKNPLIDARESVVRALKRTYNDDFKTHAAWWNEYWDQSAVNLPDQTLEGQWYHEQYKFGSASRRGAPPITLQAVWTADERRVPPWKGDYHNDLNTQLSYWPCYSGNHLEEGLSFIEWLWKIRPYVKDWTKRFYKIDGLNVPGVTAIDGAPMGGWNQYSLSPTTSAWLSHHFYLHWRYSMDRIFLRRYAYPWISETAHFLLKHSIRRADGKRKLPLSSSPEINDNRLEAWFKETTNYDLSLIRWTFQTAAELATELRNKSEANFWIKILNEWPELALAKDDGRLLVAPDYPLEASHRHFSHLMAIHPLGLVDLSNGKKDQQTIEASLAELERLGPDYWCGYSYSWLASFYARANNGDKAAQALRTFAECFCSINTFHLNGDQTKSGKSKFQYRPFTLEGNFAFAAGLQEMLLQSHSGLIRVFPAVPGSWDAASFKTLRTEGAFLVSAMMKNKKVDAIEIESLNGGTARLENPFGSRKYNYSGVRKSNIKENGKVLEIKTHSGQKILLKRQ